MPLGAGVRYRWKNGVRLAFKGKKVIEVKKKGGVAHRVNPDPNVWSPSALKILSSTESPPGGSISGVFS